MRRLLFVLASIIAIFTFSCDTTQPDFDDAVPGVNTLTTTVVPEDGGEILPAEREFVEGTPVEIEAVPNTGYTFDRWEGDLVGSLNPTFLSMTDNRSVTAYFSEIDVPLTINIVGEGSVTQEIIEQEEEQAATTAVTTIETEEPEGTLSVKPDGGVQKLQREGNRAIEKNGSTLERERPTLPGERIEMTEIPQQRVETRSQKAAITTLQLTAVPEEGWQFARWEGDLTGSQNPDTLVVEEETVVTAVFEQDMSELFTLELTVQGEGSIEAVPDTPEYSAGEEVTLTATPEEGWQFSGWQGDLGGSENPETIIMDSDKQVSSLFVMEGAAGMEIVQQPSETVAGVAISPAPAVRFLNSNNEPEQGLSIQATLNSDSFSESSITTVSTDDDGVATFDQLSVETAGGNYRIEFEALDSDVPIVSTTPFTVLAAAGDPEASSVSVPDGIAGEPTTIDITVADRFGNPVIGVEDGIDVTVTGANSASPNVTAVGEAGRYVAEYTPQSVGSDQITAEINGTAIAGTPVESVVTASDVSAENSLAEISSNELTVGQEATITITARDDQNNPLSGIEEDIELSGIENVTVSEFAEDGSTGVYSATITSTVPGGKSITVSVSGVTLDPVLVITFLTGAAENIEIISGNNQSASVSTEVPNPIVVRVTDAFNNPVEGETVTFGFDETPPAAVGLTIEPESATTNADGEASAIVTLGIIPGTYTVEASAENAGAVTFNLQATIGQASAISITSQPTTTVAGESISPSPAVEITDEAGNGIEGIEVSAELNGGSFTEESILQMSTNSSGVAVFSDLTITEAATGYTIRFTPASSSISDVTSDPFEITFAAADPENSTADVPNGSAGDQTDITITVLDEFGNPVEGVASELSLAIIQGVNSGTSFTSVSDEGDGIYLAGYTPSATGSDEITIELNGAAIEGSPFTSTVVSTDAENIEITQQPLNSVAGEIIGGAPAVLVTDGFDNEIGGVEVTVSVDGEAGLTGGTLILTTNGSGVAVFDDLVIESSGSYQLRFSALGVSEDALSDLFTVSPAAADALVEVSGNNQTAAVNAELNTPFTVRNEDAFGNPVSGETVEFSIQDTPSGSSGASLSTESVTTNSDGEASSTLTLGSVTGEYTVTASSSVGTVPFSATAVAGEVASFEFDEITSPQVAGSPFVISLTAFDSEGNVSENYSGTATLETTAGSVSPGSVTFSEGEASANVTVSQVGSDRTLTALDGDVSGTSNPFDVESGGASQAEIVQQPSETTAGQAISPAPSLRVEDSEGNPVDGVNVSVSASGVGITPGSETEVTTNANGLAQFGNLVIETAGSYTLSFDVAASGISTIESGTFTVVAANGDPNQTDASVPNGAAGEETVITITVEDAFGNRVSDAANLLSVSISGANSASPDVTEAGDGIYNAAYTPEASGTDQVAITLDGTPVSRSPYSSTVSTSEISSSESSVSANPTELVVGNSSQVTVELRDANGNAIMGLSSSDFDVTVSGNGNAGAVGEISPAGTYRFNVSNSSAQQVTVSVNASGVTLDDTPQITFTVAEPSLVVITSQPQNSVAGQIISGSPAVRVTDEFGNNISGLDVTVTEQDGQEFADGTEKVSTNGSGVAQFNDLVITNAGRYNLVFTISSSLTVTSNAFNVTPGNPDPDETTATVPNGAAGDETNITVTVRDTYENLVEGVAGQLSISISGNNGGATVTSIQDQGNGVYTASYTPTATGSDEITIELNGTDIEGSPYTSDIITSDADTIVILQDALQTIAGESIEGPPSIEVQDDLGNPVSNVEVVVSLEGSASFDDGNTTRSTNGDGITVFNNLVIETAGSYTLIFNAIGVSEDATSGPFNVVAADAETISRDSGNNQSSTVTSALADPFVVRITDKFGNPVAGTTVDFSISDTPSGATGQALSSSVITTSSDGFASTTLTLGDVAGTYTVTASAGGVGSVTFNATANAAAASSFSFDQVNSPQTAGQPFGIRIVVLDSQGNTATGYQGTADLAAANGSITPNEASFTNGTVSLDVSLTTAATGQSITATDGSIAGTSNTFDVQSGGVDAANSSVSADPSTLPAGESSTLTIELLDGSDNSLTGLEGDISIDLTGDASTGSVAGNGSGTYTADITNQTAENVTVTVSVNGVTLDDSPSIEFTPAGADDLVPVSGNGQDAEVTQQLSNDFVVRVDDGFDNPVPNVEVQFSISSTPSGASGQSLSSSSVETNSAGEASTRLTLGDTPGEYTVEATVSGVGTVTFTANAVKGAPSQMTIVTQPENTRAGQPISPSPQVQITDNAGNPISGENVTVSEDGEYVFDGGTLTRSTDESGIATFDDLVIEDSGRYALVFNASASGVANVTSNSFNVNPGVGDAESSTLEVPDGTAGEETEIKIRVEDEFGNAVNDAESNLSVSVSGDNTASPDVTKAAEEGEYAAFYTPLNAGDDRIDATLSGSELSNSPQFSTISTSDVSASESIVEANPGVLQVGNESTVTIQLKDGAGNAIAGLGGSEFFLDISGEGTAGQVNETSTSGTYEFDVSNETAQQVTVSVTVSGVTLEDQPQINFTPGDANNMVFVTQPGDAVAGEPIPGPPSVYLEDDFDNRVPGIEVSVEVQSGQSFDAGNLIVETNASGIAEFSDLVLIVAEQYNLVFSADGVSTLTSNKFTVEPADADPASTIADVPNGAATNQTTITITVGDSFGNRVTGVADDLSVTVGGANSGATVDPISEDGDGIYSTSYTPTSSGEDEITITLNGTGIAGSPYTSDVSTSEADNVEIATQPQQTVAGQPIAGPPSVRVTDTGDNNVPGVEVIAGLESGSFDSGTTSIDTDGSGIATFSDLVINTAGSYVMEFNAVGVSEDAASQLFEVIAADADELSISDGNNQAGIVSGALANPLEVQVSDDFGNPVEGVEISFAITGTPSGATGQSLATLVAETNQDGLLTTELTLGNRPGTYEVTASSDGLADVFFTATAEAGPATAYEFDAISSPQTAGQPFTISLTALDDQGNTADTYGESVSLSASLGAISPTTADFANGTVSLDVSLDQAGSDITITATDGTISATSNAFDVQTGGVDAANSSANADPAQLQAGETSLLTIELRDGNNNAVSGLEDSDFTIDVSGSGTGSAVSETGTPGTYTASVDNQTAETVTVTITANGVVLNDIPSIEFTAAEADVVTEVSGNNQTGSVTQQLSEDFVVRVEDEFNNPVEGETVTFSITGQPTGASGQTLSEESVTTNSDGLAATRLTLGDEPGTYTVDGSVSGLNTVTFSADAQTGDASQMTISTQPAETTAGEAITPAPAVTITDDADNAIEGITVTVSEQGGYSFDSGSTSEVTNASGIAEFSGLTIQTANTYSLVFDADAAGISNATSDQFDVVPAVGDPSSSSANVPDGVAGETTNITITVYDEFNNPVQGESGNLSVSVSTGANSGAAFTSITDNGDGTYSTSYTPENDGSDQIVVTLGGVDINGSPFTSEVNTGDVHASNSGVTADPTTLQAGNSSLVTVDLRDGSNNPITGLTSTDFSIDVSGAGSASSISESSTDGIYQFSVSNETAETVTVMVTASGTVLQDTPEITFTAADPDLMIISPEPGISVAGEPITGPPAVTITDEFDNPVPNAEVTVTEQGGEPFSTGSTTLVNTNAQGVAAFNNLAIEDVGQYNLVFSSAGVTNRTSNAFDVEAAGPDAAQTMADVPNGSAGDQTNITITVRDEYGNRVEGVADQLAVMIDGENAGATVATISESGNGVYTTGYTPESTGTDQVVIEVNGTGIQGSPYESTVDNSDAENIAMSQEPLLTVAGNTIAGPPSVLVTDGFGNVVSGVEVTVREQSGTAFDAGTLTVSTNTSGVAEFNDLQINTAESYTLEFDAVGVATDAVSAIFEVVADDGDPAQTTAVVPDGISNEPTAITITVRDQFGNTVDGAAPDLSVSVTGGPNQGATVSEIQDDGGGNYSASYTPTDSGTDEITITLGGTPISNSPYTSDVSAGSATSLLMDQQPSATTAGNAISPAPSVQLIDSEDNGVSGVNVTAILSSNGFTLASTTSVSTNQDGLAIFDNLVIETAETGYSITFDADASEVANVSSDLFDVTAATASTINEISGSGQLGEVNTTLADQFIVEVVDAFGNRVANETVEFSITDTPEGATGQSLSSTSVQSDSDGLASSLLTLGNVSGNYTTQASLGSETVSFSADATPGDAVSYNFEEITSPQIAGTAFSITLQALDSEANVDTSYSGTAALTTTAGSIDPGSLTFTDGVATVSVSVTDAGTGQTITADDGTISTTSNTFDVDPGEVSASESSASATSPHAANGADASTVTINLTDANGNVISGLGDTDFIVNVGENASASAVSETATDGIYQFSVTDTTVESVTVSIVVGGITIDDQPQIEFQDVEASTLEILQQPSNSTTGSTITPAPVTLVKNSDGIGMPGVNVTAFLNKNDFTEASTTTIATANNGNAIFDNLVIAMADSGYSITFNADASGVLGVLSSNFDVTTGDEDDDDGDDD